MSHPRSSVRGISLIEALVAMAVMAFGMLGVIGLQGTLRGNADLAKQRSEAVRIAQETIERWRRFTVLANSADVPPAPQFPAADYPYTYANISAAACGAVVGYTTNTSYTSNCNVDTGVAGQTTVVVTVTWNDRTGTAQSVRLFSVLSRVSPALAGSFAVPGLGGLARGPGGRSPGIPPQAKDFGDGTSGFMPPQPPGGTVAWLFNNSTGVITHICVSAVADNAALTSPTDLSSCVDTVPHQLISGFVRFFTPTAQPLAPDVIDPVFAPLLPIEVNVVQTDPVGFAGTLPCFRNEAATFVQYFCAVPSSTDTPPVWSGSLQLAFVSHTIAANLASISSAEYKVCRYRAAANYTNQGEPLLNENLLVMKAGDDSIAFTCPTPVTWPHQPAS